MLGLVFVSPARSQPTPQPIYAPIGPSTATERALRRRIIRMARIKMLERRERELREFLANAHSESPLFEDRSVADVGTGVLIGPTILTRDFLGAIMVRAMVRNRAATPRMPLLTVHLDTPQGELDATIALHAIAPGESRRIELVVPTRALPSAVRWSAAPDF